MTNLLVCCLVVCAASEPAVKLVTVQTSLLRNKGPQRLALTMPDGTNVVIRRRNDVPGVGPAAAASSNGTATGQVTTWVGEVVQPRGARGPFSYAALTVAENGGLYGEIGYWDIKLNKKRAFQVNDEPSSIPSSCNAAVC